MRVIIFGASGMVGQGVLREALLASNIESVISVGRNPVAVNHPKLRQIILTNLFDLNTVRDQFEGYDACFFCLGTSSNGTSEADFTHINYDLPLAVAQVMAIASPTMIFVYVSGMGTDTTERGKVMWARVKGATENALAHQGFKAVYLFRPAFIVPFHKTYQNLLMVNK